MDGRQNICTCLLQMDLNVTHLSSHTFEYTCWRILYEDMVSLHHLLFTIFNLRPHFPHWIGGLKLRETLCVATDLFYDVEQGLKQVSVIVRTFSLQYSRESFQPHTRVYVAPGQLLYGSVCLSGTRMQKSTMKKKKTWNQRKVAQKKYLKPKFLLKSAFEHCYCLISDWVSQT